MLVSARIAARLRLAEISAACTVREIANVTKYSLEKAAPRWIGNHSCLCFVSKYLGRVLRIFESKTSLGVFDDVPWSQSGKS